MSIICDTEREYLSRLLTLKTMDLLEKFGIKPIIQQPHLNPEELHLLKKVLELRELIDHEKEHWFYTKAKTTNEALSEAGSVLMALSSAIQAESYRLERTAAALNGHQLKNILKAIRCPVIVGNEERRRQCQQETIQKRRKLKNQLLEIIDEIWTMCEGSREESYTHFINMDRLSLLDMLKRQETDVEGENIDEDIEDQTVQVEVKNENPPVGMYS